jgi:hypothetical protein
MRSRATSIRPASVAHLVDLALRGLLGQAPLFLQHLQHRSKLRRLPGEGAL